MCVNMQKFRGNRYSWDMAIFQYFQNSDSPPSWICYEHDWSTCKEYLVVFLNVQNFVGIDAVVSIICKCSYLASLAWKCLFTPQKWRFWGLYPLNWKQPYCDPKRAPPRAETRHTTYRPLGSVQPFLRIILLPNPQILCFTMGHTLPKSAPSRASICAPSNTWFPGSARLKVPNGILIGSAVFAQLKPEGPYTLQLAAPIPLKLPISMGMRTWFLGPTRVHNPNGISIGSAVFAGLTTVRDRETNRYTTLLVR